MDFKEARVEARQRIESFEGILNRYFYGHTDRDVVLYTALKHGIKSPQLMRIIGLLQRESLCKAGGYKALIEWLEGPRW
jgi:hypothetical protein